MDVPFEYKNIGEINCEENELVCIRKLIEKNNYKCFFVELKPYKTISFHEHSSNDQSVIFLDGEGEYEINDKKIKVHKNIAVFIKRGVKHGLENLSNKRLKYIEITI